VPIALSTAAALRSHLASEHGGTTYVFETATGRPFDRHNVGRSLRRTLASARDENGEPIFPRGERLPSLHSFRHTTATYLLHNGASADDVARRLRHKDATVTRAVYIHELEDAARRQHDRRMMDGLLG
jgi:integrase